MKQKTKGRGWQRHLDGWQAGAVLLLLAGSAILLGMPRAVPPELPPPPSIDGAALQAIMDADDARAQAAIDHELDHDIRAVGKHMRDYNLAAADDIDHEAQAARGRLLAAAKRALVRSKEEMLQLRAYQMRRFIEELTAWSETGIESDELRALGGDFTRTLSRNRWCKEGSRELVMSDRELRVLYKRRWNDVAELHGPTFDLSSDENRIRFGFLIRYPFNVGGRPGTRGALLARTRARLDMIEKLAATDPGYPVDLARGVVLYRAGSYTKAGDLFRRHLKVHPDGPHALRATNYLKASLDMSVHDMSR